MPTTYLSERDRIRLGALVSNWSIWLMEMLDEELGDYERKEYTEHLEHAHLLMKKLRSR